MKIFSTVILTLLLLLVNNDFGQSKVNLFSLQNRKKFADYLFCNKDYLRAFDEYKIYLSEVNNDTIKFKIALGFRKMRRYGEALDYLKSLFFNSKFAIQARNEYFKTLLMANKINAIRRYIKEPIFITGDSLKVPLKLFYVAKMFGNTNLPDSNELKKIFTPEEYSQIDRFYWTKKNLPLKSLTKAGILSALIPGLGKIYTQNYGDGITAFLFTAALGTLAYANFKARHKFRAWLFSGLTALFYSGNIYGSVASAQIFNAKIAFDFRKKLKLYLEKVNYFVPQYNFICN